VVVGTNAFGQSHGTGRYAAEEVHRFSEKEKTVARDINEA
jgi:hypothetical protein